jgi:cytochrome P450
MNAWTMHRDPKVFPEPEAFRPERFLELGEDGKRKALYLFGLGSRMCPGDQFAQAALVLTVAKILWSYEIVPIGPLDFSIQTGYQDGLVSSPRSVPVEFKLHEDSKRSHIVQDFERTQSILEHMGL